MALSFCSFPFNTMLENDLLAPKVSSLAPRDRIAIKQRTLFPTPGDED